MKLENYQMKYQNLEQLTTVVDGVNILVSTIGQLAFLQEVRIFDLGDLDFFVIDEADQILRRASKNCSKTCNFTIPTFEHMPNATCSFDFNI